MAVSPRWRHVLAGSLALAMIGASCGDDGGEADVADANAANDTGVEETGDGDVSTSEADVAGTDAAAGDGELCTPERAGGSITAGTWLAFDGLDPFVIQGAGVAGGDLANAFYGTLLRYDPPTDVYEPMIAEAVEPGDDRSVWTVRLRDDVEFGNGDQFTTEHVVAHIERMQEAAVRGSAMAQMVEDVEIVDDFEMVVTLTEPANLRYMFAADLGWIPNKDLVAERGDGFHVDFGGAGAGPFELERLSESAGEELVFSGKDDYWGGEVCLDELRFVNILSEETMLEAFDNGELDTMFTQSNRVAKELGEAGRLAYDVPIGSLYHGVANQWSGEEPFTDVRVREALQLAIDYELVSSRVWEDPPATTSAFVPEESPLWVEGLEGPPYDPDRARELVEETISEGVWDGSFTYTYLAGDPTLEELSILLQGLWEAVGMDVTLDPVPSSAQKVIVDKDFDVASWGTAFIPPWPHTSAATLQCDISRNRSGFCDPEMDEALATLREALTIEEIQDALLGMQEIFNTTFPIFVTRHSIWGVGAQEHVHGLLFGTESSTYYDRAWVDQ